MRRGDGLNIKGDGFKEVQMNSVKNQKYLLSNVFIKICGN